MHSDELELAVGVWRDANIARGAAHGPERNARIRAKLSAPDALPFVALRPDIVGMALAEPGRFCDGRGDPDPSLLHISMVFVHPSAQRSGVGLPLVLRLLEVARSLGCERVGVWTAAENTAARKLYERAGMTLTERSAPGPSGSHLQYEWMQTVFEAAGSEPGLLRLAAAWHERVLADEVVSHAFSHGFHPDHTERLAAYWTEALGGPMAFSATYGDESAVVRMHSGNGAHEEMDRRAIACFDQALGDVGLAQGRVAQTLHDYFAWATTTTMSRYHESADEVPAGLAIPRWSWDGLVA